MEETGIVRNEIANDRHQADWDNLIGVAAQKEQALAWAALTLGARSLGRTATGLNRLALVGHRHRCGSRREASEVQALSRRWNPRLGDGPKCPRLNSSPGPFP